MAGRREHAISGAEVNYVLYMASAAGGKGREGSSALDRQGLDTAVSVWHDLREDQVCVRVPSAQPFAAAFECVIACGQPNVIRPRSRPISTFSTQTGPLRSTGTS